MIPRDLADLIAQGVGRAKVLIRRDSIEIYRTNGDGPTATILRGTHDESRGYTFDELREAFIEVFPPGRTGRA